MTSVNERRLTWPVKAEKPSNVFQCPLDYGVRNMILDWMDEHTSGEFYIGPNTIYFVEDKDAMAFKLWDVLAKIEMWKTLKKKNL